MKIVVSRDDNPFFNFKLLVSNKLLDETVQRSNKYARGVIDSNRPLRRKSLLTKWKEVTSLEIKKLFGLVFHMGLLGMPSYRECWSMSHLYKNNMFSSVISQERFQSIIRFLHFGNEPQQPRDH